MKLNAKKFGKILQNRTEPKFRSLPNTKYDQHTIYNIFSRVINTFPAETYFVDIVFSAIFWKMYNVYVGADCSKILTKGIAR